MAYTQHFNPDALPAHASPDEAAQALSNLRGNRRDTSHHISVTSPLNPNLTPTSPPPARRASPVGLAAQHSYRPTHVQPSHQHQHQQFHPHTSVPSYTPSYGQQHDISHIYSPPPANYGDGPPPPPPPKTDFSDRRTIHPSIYPSRTPRPPSPDSADLYSLFRAANTSGSGTLTAQELSSALVNADYTPFDPVTIRTMMRLFSSHPTYSTITYPEFQNLWRFLAAWRELFERFDEDASGRVSLSEFSKALVAFGYRLSQPFVGVVYNIFTDKQRYAEERNGSAGNQMGPARGQGMSFDLFVQACISLKRMTDVFKGYDEDRDGYVTLSFEEFLTEILRLRE